MHFPPLTVIASWPVPQYDDPVSRGNALLVVAVFFSVLTVLACVGRFYSRICIKHWFGWDDGFIIVALVFSISMNALVILANRQYGWDRHIWDVKPTVFETAGIAAFAAKLLFVGASSFTRLSLICFYYRLVKDSGIDWFNKILHASVFFVVALGIAFTCIGIWLCVPVQAYWVFPMMEGSKCLNEGTATLVVGVFNCVADLLCTLLPIPLVWGLKMPVKHRIGVCILLSLGFIVTIAGVLRTYFIWQSLISSWDVTWYSYPLWICATVEIDLAVICACAPSWKPLLHQPLLRCAASLSSKFSRSSSLQQSPMTSRSRTPKVGLPSSSAPRSMHSILRKFPFFRHGVIPSPLDTFRSGSRGDEEYGMLNLEGARSEKDCNVQVTASLSGKGHRGTFWSDQPTTDSSKSLERRGPGLEIMQHRTVDQEVEYISRQGSSPGSLHSPVEYSLPRSHGFDK